MPDDVMRIRIDSNTPETQATKRTFREIAGFPQRLQRNFILSAGAYAASFNHLRWLAQSVAEMWETHHRKLLQDIQKINDETRKIQATMAMGKTYGFEQQMAHTQIAKKYGLPFGDIQKIQSTVGQYVVGRPEPWVAPVAAAKRVLGDLASVPELSSFVPALGTYGFSEMQAAQYAAVAAKLVPGPQAAHTGAMQELIALGKGKVGGGFADLLYPYMTMTSMKVGPRKASVRLLQFLKQVTEKEQQVETFFGDQDLIQFGKVIDLPGLMDRIAALPDADYERFKSILPNTRVQQAMDARRNIGKTDLDSVLNAYRVLSSPEAVAQKFAGYERDVTAHPAVQEYAAIQRGKTARIASQIRTAPERAFYAQYLEMLQKVQLKSPWGYRSRYFKLMGFGWDPLKELEEGGETSMAERALVNPLLQNAASEAQARGLGPQWASRQALVGAWRRAQGWDMYSPSAAGLMGLYEAKPEKFAGKYPELYEQLEAVPEKGFYAGWEKERGFGTPVSQDTHTHFHNGGRASDQAALRSAALVGLGFAGMGAGVSIEEALTLQPH